MGSSVALTQAADAAAPRIDRSRLSAPGRRLQISLLIKLKVVLAFDLQLIRCVSETGIGEVNEQGLTRLDREKALTKARFRGSPNGGTAETTHPAA